jgi:transcriptional regulator with XRE-family HTH domain
MNYALFRAIRENGLRQRDFAQLVGDHESIVSRIVNGVWNPDEIRKIRYAKALGHKPEDLFPNEDTRHHNNDKTP